MITRVHTVRPSRRFSILAVAVTGVLAGSLLSAPAADSAPPPTPDAQCPEAFPRAEVTPGLAVSGLTVSHGTVPEPFSGEIIGVLDGGIAPGVDLIVARLSAPAIDAVGGIWAGMSGSPVFAEDGRLIGAVSYSLSNGASPVAGITPAEAMRAWLDPIGPTVMPAPRQTVALPAPTSAEIVEDGLATRAEVASGMSQIPLPIAISGAANPKRLRQLADLLGSEDELVYATGGATAGTPADEIVAGGNVATTLSYGDVTYGGVGTVTQVCGEQVLAFGHPAFWSGPTTLSLHSADVVYVQPDPFRPYKAANITGVAGTITDDRYTAIHGYLGAPPETTTLIADSRSGEGPERIGRSYASIPDSLPGIATSHLLVNLDRVFDGIGRGSSKIQMTVSGARSGGVPFEVTRVERFASPYDITIDSVWDTYETMSRLLNNRFTPVTIDQVEFTSFVDRDYREYRVGTVKRLRSGQWQTVDRSTAIRVRPGTTLRLRVTLNSVGVSGSRIQSLALSVPDRAAGKRGTLTIVGGNSVWSRQKSTSFEDLLSDIRSEVHNNDLVSTLWIKRRGADLVRSRRSSADSVVSGSFQVGVRVAQ